MDKKENAIKTWQYRKDHTFLVSHDGLSLIKYIKGGLDLAWPLLIAAIIGCAIMGAITALVLKTSMISCIIGWLIFVVSVFLIRWIYGYFLYLNYVDDDEIYGPTFSVIIAIVVADKTKWWIGIIALLICTYICIRFDKSQNYDKQNTVGDVYKELYGEEISNVD